MNDQDQHTVRYWAIVPAAGVGSRMGADKPKQYLTVLGKPLIEHTLERLLELDQVSRIYVGISNEDTYWPSLAVASNGQVSSFQGASERHLTVLEGLRALDSVADENDWILVHDAARPCVEKQAIDNLIKLVADSEVGGLLAHPIAETLKYADSEQRVENTVDRSRLWAAQTPQMFRYGLLKKAIEQAVEANIHVTDESSAIEALGHKPTLVEAPSSNVKVTRSSDLDWVERWLGQASVN